MARRRSTHLPAAKQRGQNSYVWHPVERQWVYLGRWGSQEAETRWRRMAAEYVRNPHSGVTKADGVLVAEIMAAYLEWLKLNGASPNVPRGSRIAEDDGKLRCEVARRGGYCGGGVGEEGRPINGKQA